MIFYANISNIAHKPFIYQMFFYSFSCLLCKRFSSHEKVMRNKLGIRNPNDSMYTSMGKQIPDGNCLGG